MSARSSLLLAAFLLVVGVAAKPVSDPKLKEVGNIDVEYAKDKSPEAAALAAQWVTGLDFKNAPGVHSAVCIYDPADDDFHVDGLHLTGDAARALAADLEEAAGTRSTGGVEVVNHRDHRDNVWVALRPQDARLLASRITGAAKGHAGI